MNNLPRRLLLVEPPFSRLFGGGYSLPRYPLWMGYICGTVKRETNREVMAYNADFLPEYRTASAEYLAGPGYRQYLANLASPSGSIWQDVRRTIADFRPDEVGISSKTQNFAAARIVAGIAKEVAPKALVILGGPHISMAGAEVLACPHIDIAVRGEGERTISALLKALDGGVPLEAVNGIYFRSDGVVRQTAPRELIADLDSLCFPHQSAPSALKDYALYPRSAFQRIFASRGCPFNCTFCGSRYVWTRTVRRRSVPNVVEEIRLLRDFGVKGIHFEDDTFGGGRPYIHDLARALREAQLGLEWSCELHVNLVDDDVVRAMRSSGCVAIHLGVESGNNAMLKAIRKGFTIEKAVAAARTIQKHGILLHTFFMAGFPQETEESIRDTVAAMKACRPESINFSIFTPYPGTESFQTCQEMGLIPDDFDISLYNHQSPANHFCQIEARRFRELTADVERFVRQYNQRNAILDKFMPGKLARTARKAVELGPREVLRRAASLLSN